MTNSEMIAEGLVHANLTTFSALSIPWWCYEGVSLALSRYGAQLQHNPEAGTVDVVELPQ